MILQDPIIQLMDIVFCLVLN